MTFNPFNMKPSTRYSQIYHNRFCIYEEPSHEEKGECGGGFKTTRSILELLDEEHEKQQQNLTSKPE